jgi:hypothetical protein
MTGSEVLRSYKNKTVDNPEERALWLLLDYNNKAVSDLIEENMSWTKFRDSFRKIDVTGNGKIDLAIWHLMENALTLKTIIQKRHGKPVVPKWQR